MVSFVLSFVVFHDKESWWPSGKVSGASRRLTGSKPDSIEDLKCMWTCCMCGSEVWRGWSQFSCRPCHLTTLQNYEKVRSNTALRVASKRNVNITKLNKTASFVLSFVIFHDEEGPRWPSSKVLVAESEVPGSKPDSIENLSCVWICCTFKHA
ncbi:hypothetical protein AVEN_243233-1 [Araneus ventricosus]|uniref:Uncharacterized protein n=1 Tax=Araneus ventricosus TaxID=182803 RepID=A0A4Y2R7G9_ARAVE|nr:hypothetical protein AVEN_243233-1 [Araneus ventricosus]